MPSFTSWRHPHEEMKRWERMRVDRRYIKNREGPMGVYPSLHLDADR